MKSIKILGKNNKQKNMIKSVEYADTFTKRLIGLMGQKAFKGMLFKQKRTERIFSSIHTSFMKVPIDIIYINKNMEVIEKTMLKPWKIHIPENNNIKYILELPVGHSKLYDIKLKDKMVIKDEQ